MGSFRFRRTVKIAPGIRLNVNKRSIGVSAGVRGARISKNSDGRSTRSIGVPGTGLYYRSQKGPRPGTKSRSSSIHPTPPKAALDQLGAARQKLVADDVRGTLKLLEKARRLAAKHYDLAGLAAVQVLAETTSERATKRRNAAAARRLVYAVGQNIRYIEHATERIAPARAGQRSSQVDHAGGGSLLRSDAPPLALCTSCGLRLTPGANFCAACGHAVVVDNAGRVLSEPSPATQVPPPTEPGAIDDDPRRALDLGVIDRVPRSPAEESHLLATRPEGWEYLLWAAVLLRRMNDLEPKWREHAARYRRPVARTLSGEPSAFVIASNALTEAAAITDAIVRPLTPQWQERVFGKPGEPGDPQRITQLANGIIDGYDRLLDWAAQMRASGEPARLQKLSGIVSEMADRPLRQIREFVDHTVTGCDKIPAALRDKRRLELVLDLTLSADPSVFKRYERERNRLKGPRK